MKIKLSIALLLLLAMFGLHLSCSQYAVHVEEIVEEKEIGVIFEQNIIH